MVCSDCHDPHGQQNDNIKAEGLNVNQLCYKCHADKQGPFAHPHPPVTENCAYCHSPHGAVANNLLKTFNLEDKKDQSPYLLSMGEKRRLSVATMLAIEPEVLILDEPTTGLDRKDTDNLMDVLSQFVSEKNVTVIQVSHDMEQVAEFASRVIILNEGNIVFDNTPQMLFANQALLQSCKLTSPPVAVLSKQLWPDQPNPPITVKGFLQEVPYAGFGI